MKSKTKSAKRTKFKTAAEAAAHLADDPRVSKRVRALTQAHTRRTNAYEKYFGDSGKKLLDKVLAKRRTKLAKEIADMLFDNPYNNEPAHMLVFQRKDGALNALSAGWTRRAVVYGVTQLLKKWKV